MKEGIIKYVKMLGLGFLEPLIRINEKPKVQLVKFFKMAIIPLLAFLAFIWLWGLGAEAIQDIVNDKEATVTHKNSVDKAKKQLGMDEKAAVAYADAVVDTFWYKKNKARYLDDIRGELLPAVTEMGENKKKVAAKLGIKASKDREYGFYTMSKINALPSMLKSTIKMDTKNGIGQNSKTIYLIFTEEDLKSLPASLIKANYNGSEIKITPDDLYDVLTLGEYNYMYEMTYLPRPKDVWKKWKLLLKEHEVEKEKEEAFYEAKKEKIAAIKKSKKSKEEKEEAIKAEENKSYPGYPTIIDQIYTSIYTVLTALLLAAFIAVPLGIFMGLSPVFKTAINPIVQLLKPVSPVVWYMLVAMIVNALIDTETAWLPKHFTISFIAVACCAMWATLINTSVGVASVEQDLLNVASVLKVKGFQKIFKVILPSSIPMIFTGLRITVTTSWMVLIAVELLAQNPGLGKFVWDEFQNGSSNSNAKIVAAMFVIGIIGFFLDRIMMLLQKYVSFEKKSV